MNENTYKFILDLIKLLKPKFYNKLTWLIVISGLSIMSTPLWLIILNNVLEQELSISITSGSDTIWGFMLCFLGLTYHLINTGLLEYASSITDKHKRLKIDTHDLGIYEYLHNLLPEEYLEHLIAYIQTNDAIRYDDLKKLEKFVSSATSESYQFVTQQLNEDTKSLCDHLSSFLNHVNSDFDEYPYGQGVTNFRMCLAPQLNCDRAGNWEDGPEYDKLVSKMMDCTSNIQSFYKIWRSHIKHNLYV